MRILCILLRLKLLNNIMKGRKKSINADKKITIIVKKLAKHVKIW